MDLDGVFDDDGDAQGMLKELEGSTVEDITMRTRLLENEIRVLRDESNRLALDLQSDKEKVKENVEKIKMNKQLPYLVGNVVEILDMNPEVGGGGDAARHAIPDPSAPPPPLSVRSDARPVPHPALAARPGGGGGGRRQRRPRLPQAGQGGRAQDDDEADHLPPRHRTRRRRCEAVAIETRVSDPAGRAVLRAAVGGGPRSVLKRLLFPLFPSRRRPSSR
jgi:hypothetical protein